MPPTRVPPSRKRTIVANPLVEPKGHKAAPGGEPVAPPAPGGVRRDVLPIPDVQHVGLSGSNRPDID